MMIYDVKSLQFFYADDFLIKDYLLQGICQYNSLVSLTLTGNVNYIMNY